MTEQELEEFINEYMNLWLKNDKIQSEEEEGGPENEQDKGRHHKN